MTIWKDRDGNEWQLSINLLSARKLSKLPLGEDGVKVNLAMLTQDAAEVVKRLATDVWLMVDVLFVLSKRVDGTPVADADFADALGVEHFCVAQKAFWDELQVFYRQIGFGVGGLATTAMRAAAADALPAVPESLQSS